VPLVAGETIHNKRQRGLTAVKDYCWPPKLIRYPNPLIEGMVGNSQCDSYMYMLKDPVTIFTASTPGGPI
jgi:hypothetical protein